MNGLNPNSRNPADPHENALTRTEKQALIEQLLRAKKILPNSDTLNGENLIPTRSGSRFLPLSSAQQRLWIIDNIDEGSLPYIMSATLEFTGRLNTAYLVSALGELLARHEILRTQYRVEKSGEVYQHIVADAPLDFRMESCAANQNWQEKLDNLRTQELQTGFNLQTDIVFRARLLRVSAERHFLVLTTHHIAADGWSIGLLNEELSALYAAYAGGANALPDNTLQYADYAIWQRQQEDKIIAAQLPYWREKLAGCPASCSFPVEFPRPEHSSYRGANVRQLIEGNLWRAVKKLTQDHRVTTFMVLHGLLASLLHRFTGETDIVIGTPVANREQSQVKNMIGFFVNTLVLRLDFGNQPGFDAVLAKCKRNLLEACDHQQLPFEKLVEELQVPRSTNRNPLFQVVLAYNNTASGNNTRFGRDSNSGEVELSGVTVRRLPQKTLTSKFDICLNVENTPDGLEIVWEYATDLYSHHAVQTLAEYFELLLAAVAENPQCPVNQLSLLTAAQREQLARWNETSSVYPRESHLWELFTEQVQEQGDKIALWETTAEGATLKMSYTQLQARAEQLARRINLILPVAQHREAMQHRDIIVGVMSERSASAVVAWLALARLGYAYLPLDPQYPTDRLQHMINDADCALVLTQNTAQIELLPQRESYQVLPLDRENLYQGELPEVAVPTIGSDRLVYVMYTSGSTGKPKGVMIEQASIVRLIKNTGYAPLSSDDHVLLTGAPVFDATTYEVWGSLLNGGTLSIVHEHVLLDTEQLADTLAQRQITTLWLTAPLFNQHVQQKPAMFAGVRQLLVGGDALSVEHIRLAKRANPQLTLINGYGPTENTTFSVCHRLEADQPLGEISSIPIGRPIHNSTAHVVNDAGQPVPVGVCGELWVGGEGVARGYLNRPDLTAEKFIADPFSHRPGARLYKTGDLVRWTREGFLEFIGRVDDQVKIRGFRIELGEIDTVLTRHRQVEEARVLVKQDGQGNKQLVGYVAVGAALAELDQSALRCELLAYLREQLPDYMVPAALVLLERLPLNSNGKVDRRQLPEPEFALSHQPMVAPQDATERKLLDIWQLLLGVQSISVTDNFFAIGGDSILAIRMVASARDAGMALTVKKIFEGKTIRDIARLATAGVRTRQSLPVTGEQLLLPIQEDFFAGNPDEYNHFNQHVMVHLDKDISMKTLSATLQWLVEKHDVMRLKFNCQQGRWRGFYRELASIQLSDMVEEHRLEGFSGRALSNVCDDIATTAQSTLNINTGVIWRWVVLRTSDETRLLWIMHHLIVDGVSWRVLLQDLQKCLQAQQLQQPLPAIHKTGSAQEWAERLADYASGEALVVQREYWRERPAVSLPFVDTQLIDVREKYTRKQHLLLTDTDTRRLLQESQQAYHTRINDLLLSALVLALETCMAQSSPLDLAQSWPLDLPLRVDLEGHGREELFEGFDLSETLGWFTSIYPVYLQRAGGDVAATIVNTKEILAEVPHNGIDFGIARWLGPDAQKAGSAAAIAFNYLGQLDPVGDQPALAFSLDNCGNPIGDERQRSHAIRITGFVKDQQLQFVVDYHSQQVNAMEMVRFSDSFKAALQQIVEHCAKVAPQFTPADFPLVKPGRELLARLQQTYSDIVALYPMTPMQQSLVLQSLRSRDQKDVYVTQLHFSFKEADNGIMRRAWQQVCDRHDIFRTVFIDVESERPLQLVRAQAPIEWREITLTREQQQNTDQAFNDISRSERQQGFDFAEKPAQRFVWIHHTDGCELIWSHHHALIDGWCLAILLEELLEVYAAMNRARPAVLAAVENYGDYLQWLNRKDPQSDSDFWRNYLNGAEGATQLVVEGSPPTGERRQLAESLTLSTGLTADLTHLAQHHGVTLNAILQGAWALLLSKYSGEKDVLFGTTVSGRPAELRGADKMVGLFINTLPVRQKFETADLPIGQWLTKIHEQMQEATEHGYLPLGEIQQQSSFGTRQALFESVLVFENYPLDITELNHRIPGQPLFKKISGVECSDLPLNLVIYPGDSLVAKLAYQSDRFDPAAISRVLRHFQQILQSITEVQRLDQVTLLSAEEVRLATQEWNDTAQEFPREKTLYECFAEWVAIQPTAIAIVDAAETLSYEQLDQRATALAARLMASGVGVGDRVAVSLPKGADVIVAMLAVMRQGAVYVPIALDCPVDRRKFITDDAGITHTLVNCGSLPALTALGFACITMDGADAPTTGLAVLPSPMGNAAGEAYVIYTSGTTGTPKGVAIAHRSLVNLCYSCMADNWLQPGDAALQFAPFTFDASMAEVFVCLLSGGQLHLVDDATVKDPQLMQHYLRDHAIRLAAFPPQYLQQLDPAALPGSLTILTAGSAPSLALVQAWGAGRRYMNAYGPTETTVLSSAWDYQPQVLDQGRLPIGRPLANTQIYIVDHFGQLCAPGQKGEILIGGEGVALGYLNRPDQTTAQFRPNPWRPGERVYHTGDLGRWLADGSIEFIGRCDHQVKIRGFRIEPDEIERCCRQLPLVEQCLVLPQADRFGDLQLVAYLQSRAPAKNLLAEIKSHVAAALPHYMMPAQFVVQTEFPMTAHGKIDRKALVQLALIEQEHSASAPVHATDNEGRLLQIWRHFLALPELQVNDDFFESGGNSILLLRMMGPMKDAGFTISVNEFYQRRTVRKCCALFAKNEQAGDFWNKANLPFDVVTLDTCEERVDFWLVEKSTDRELVQRYFNALTDDQLPDFIEFVEDLPLARFKVEQEGKQALCSWHLPYPQTLRKHLKSGLQAFAARLRSRPIVTSSHFSPMQESMLNWEDRTVFELIDIVGYYTGAQLQSAFNRLVENQELLHAFPDHHRHWQIVDARECDFDIPWLDLRYLDTRQQHTQILELVTDLQQWQRKSGLPYGACWVSVSDTRHRLVMVMDHLISDESSSLAIKTFLRSQLKGEPIPSGRHFSDFVAHVDSCLHQDSAQILGQILDWDTLSTAREKTELALARRKKMPLQRALFRVPLDYNSSALDQSFSIFRKLVCALLKQDDFCMMLNHYGRQMQGENDFHQVGLFLDKIPFMINASTQLDDINRTVKCIEDYGINVVGLAKSGYLGRQTILSDQNCEILFNYQGDQYKDAIVQQWFSRLDIRSHLKKFSGLVFEARQLEKELAIHCIFRGKKSEGIVLMDSINGARPALHTLDRQDMQRVRSQGRKSRARDALYRQLKIKEPIMQHAIQVHHLQKSYGDFAAVKGVSFAVEKGKCFGILGPNGAGKTTLLSMLEGITKPTAGSIHILGMDIAKHLDKIQPLMGVQLQQNNYFQFLKVEDMLRFYRDFRAASAGRNKGLSIDELLERLSLSDKRKALVDELSGGQKQRLTIAIALLQDPDIIFLDEPTSALDPQNRRYTWEFIEQLKAQGDKTIIITTHYMEEAERLCDEIMIMNHGEIIAQGSPDQLIESLNAHYNISVLLGKGELDDTRLRALSGVSQVQWGINRKELTISTTQSATTLRELIEYSETTGIELLQFNINRPSLEDVFLSSTGKELRE